MGRIRPKSVVEEVGTMAAGMAELSLERVSSALMDVLNIETNLKHSGTCVCVYQRERERR